MMGASRPGQATLAALWSGLLLVVVALQYMPTSLFSSMLETRRPRSRLHSHRAPEADPARQPAAVSLLSMVCRTRIDNCAILAAAAASSATVVRNARSSRE